ncbi:glycosyltransferase family 9 protein [Ignavibacteria bacterium]|nr:glycosyltransferase family 9 protein [Bacteroidota bacterium]MCZ2132129.1 glycosyltransferase family 9 protein [Bacteroidota bacterium]
MPALETITVIRTDRLGDMVLTLPLLGVLRRTFPEVQISLIARSYVADLLYNCPVIDSVVYSDKLSGGTSEALTKLRPDMVFFPRPRFGEALSAFIQSVPIRVGSRYRWYSSLFTDKIPEHRSDALHHEAEYNVRMAHFMLERRFPDRFSTDIFTPELIRPIIQPQSAESVKILLEQNGINIGLPFAVIHPGSGGSARDWPAENFAELAAFLTTEIKIPIIITGIAAESNLCEFVKSNAPSTINLCGALSLAEMTALLDMAALMIAGSTGTLHIAAALGTPVIGLYPNTPSISAHRWGPLSHNSIVISPPQGDDMSLIGVEQVAEAAQTSLSNA